jgi:hypothetical protein
MKKLVRTYYLLMTALICGLQLNAQTMIPLPSQGSVYTGNVRGFWFTAPTNFIITGLRVPTSAGSGSQYIQLVKFTSAGPPSYSASTTAFTTLAFIQHAPNGVINPVNISISTGDIIGVLGQDSLNHNSYATPTGPYTSSINGSSVTLTRMLYQGQLRSGAAGPISQETSAALARVEIYWIPPYKGPNDAGVFSVDSPASNCAGIYNAVATIKNYGTNRITSLTVNWRLNGVYKTPISWTGLLDTANGSGSQTAQINLGSITLGGGTSNNIVAWTTNPNNKTDTINYNDTAKLAFSGYNYPTVNFGPDKSICPGTALTLNAGSNRDSVRWSNSTTLDTLAVSSAGTYSVRVYKNGCMGGDTINIGMYPAPPTVNFGPDTTLCVGETLVLNATASGVTYLWQDNSTAATYSVTTAGTYSVVITDGNGCESTDKIVVKYHKSPSVTISVAPKNNLCYGDPFTFTANAKSDGSIAYQWKVNGLNSGAQTTSKTFTGPVAYGDSVSVDLITDLCATSPYPVPSNKIQMLINPSPKTVGGPIQVLENTSAQYAVGIVSGSTFAWSVTGGAITTSSANTATVLWGSADPNANITCTETDSKNCSYPNVVAVNVISIIGIKENGQQLNMGRVYPNPANTTINIPLYCNGDWNINLSLFDVSGKEVKSVYAGVISGETKVSIDVSDLKNGLYFCKVISAEGYTAVRKIEIRH